MQEEEDSMKRTNASFRLSTLGLQMKFVISYCLAVSLLCGLVGFVYYKTTSDALYDMVTRDSLTILQKNNQIIDQQLENVENYANSFVADDSLDEYITEYWNARSVYEYYRLDRSVTRLLHNYFSSSPSIFSAYVMTRQISYGELFGSNIIPVQNFPQSRIYQAAVEGGGKTVWFPTYNFFTEYGQAAINPETDPYRNVFSAAKLIRQTPEDYVILVLNFQDDVYTQIFETQFVEYESSYLVITPDGQVVCRDSASCPDFSDDPSVFEEAFHTGSGYTLLEFGGEPFIVCYDVSNVTGWLSMWIIPQGTLVNQFIRSMVRNLTVILVILILLPLILILFMNQKLLKPLESLRAGIQKTGKGNFQTVVKVQGFAEIRSLIQSFNESNEKIDHLIKENYESRILIKEAELAARDLQLNPHFILNTLNLISLELIQDGNDELCETISALSRVIEYTLRTRSLLVPFSLDLDNTQNYLRVMQKRYREIFSVKYEIDQSLLDTQVPKLFLQPLVENSIRHGFASVSRNGLIVVRAQKRGPDRIFEVEDNGCGFSDDALREIQDKNSPHIGINNIRYRIQYLYGAEYNLDILPVQPHGALIRIVLPG